MGLRIEGKRGERDGEGRKERRKGGTGRKRGERNR